MWKNTLYMCDDCQIEIVIAQARKHQEHFQLALEPESDSNAKMQLRFFF